MVPFSNDTVTTIFVWLTMKASEVFAHLFVGIRGQLIHRGKQACDRFGNLKSVRLLNERLCTSLRRERPPLERFLQG